MRKLFRSPLRFVLIPLVIAGFVFLAGFVVMTLWNYTLPEIFGVPVITLWQAIALFFLCKMLFGFGGRGNRRGGPPWMGKSMKKRCEGMNAEEKERFKAAMRRRMGHWGDETEKTVIED